MRGFFAPGSFWSAGGGKLLEVEENVVRALIEATRTGRREEIDGFWVPHRLFCDPGSGRTR